MITIRPSNVTEHDDTPPQEDVKKRIPLVWIPITLGIGLLIAALYLRGRIVATHPPAKPQVVHVAAPATVPVVQAPAQAPPQASAPHSPAPTEAATTTKEPAGVDVPAIDDQADDIPMIAPHSGERYIQIGALTGEATRHFIQRLRNQKLNPHVAPGPTPELLRVLIGPFDDRDALNAQKAQLESESIPTFVRQY
jgi:cell division septation protein DedD